MKFYGKKFIANKVDKQISSRKETKDAIVWDVLPEDKIALIRIQGSSTNIVARYPENWEQTPAWLKSGNAVKVNFTGGNRGRVELIGHGYLIPTPIDGSDIQPKPEVFDDVVLSGVLVYPIPLNQRMAVMVTTGIYKMNGTIYNLGPITMDDYDPWYMDDGGGMGKVAAIINIDPPEGYFRYDLIVVGDDGIVDYVKGTSFTNIPIEPVVPSGHICLNQIFVYPGMTSVGYSDIGKTFIEPFMSGLHIAIDDNELDWSETSTDIVVNAQDQYGNIINLSDGVAITMKMISGNGTIASHIFDESTTELNTPVTSHVFLVLPARFTYTRHGEITDESPVFQANLDNANSPIFALTNIYLLDEEGERM